MQVADFSDFFKKIKTNIDILTSLQDVKEGEKVYYNEAQHTFSTSSAKRKVESLLGSGYLSMIVEGTSRKLSGQNRTITALKFRELLDQYTELSQLIHHSIESGVPISKEVTESFNENLQNLNNILPAIKISLGNLKQTYHIPDHQEDIEKMIADLEQSLEAFMSISENFSIFATHPNGVSLIKSAFPLHDYAKKNEIHLDEIKELIEMGFDLNQRDADKKTPLFYACKAGNIDLVEYLLSLGATDVEGDSPLHAAIRAGSLNRVSSLLDRELQTLFNEEGDTPLTLAVKTNSEIASYLINQGFADEPNEWGITPFWIAFEKKDYATAYLIASADGFSMPFDFSSDKDLSSLFNLSSAPESTKLFYELFKNIDRSAECLVHIEKVLDYVKKYDQFQVIGYAIKFTQTRFANALIQKMIYGNLDKINGFDKYVLINNLDKLARIFPNLLDVLYKFNGGYQDYNSFKPTEVQLETLYQLFLPFAKHFEYLSDLQQEIILDTMCLFNFSELITIILEDADSKEDMLLEILPHTYESKNRIIFQFLLDQGLSLDCIVMPGFTVYDCARSIGFLSTQNEIPITKREITRRLLFSIWSVQYYTEDVKENKNLKRLDGGNGSDVYIIHYLSQFLNHLQLNQSELDLVFPKKLYEILDTYLVSESWDKEKIMDHYQNNSPLVFYFRSYAIELRSGHQSFVAIIGDYLLIGDRGGLNPEKVTVDIRGGSNEKQPFMKVFKINRKIPIKDPEVLLKLNTQVRGTYKEVYEFLYKTIPENLGVEEDEFLQQFCNSQKKQLQKIGNCWIANPLLGLIAIPLVLQYIEDPSGIDKSYSETKTFYKAFIHYFRVELLKDYLAAKEDEMNEKSGNHSIDIPMVSKIIQKMRSPKWKARLHPGELDEILDTIERIIGKRL